MTVLDAFSLKGKRALVTGGNRGLGFAFVRGLAEAGADVVFVSRDVDRNAAAAVQVIVNGQSQAFANQALTDQTGAATANWDAFTIALTPARATKQYRYRYTGAALTSDFAWLIGAGFAPLVALFLSQRYGLAMIGVYLLPGAVCSLVALFTDRSELRQM